MEDIELNESYMKNSFLYEVVIYINALYYIFIYPLILTSFFLYAQHKNVQENKKQVKT